MKPSVVNITSPSNNTLLNVGTTVNITWTVNENVGISGQWVTITGPGGYNQTFNSAMSAYAWAIPTVAGDYTIKVYAKDLAGNQGESGAITVRVRAFPYIQVARKDTSTGAFRLYLYGKDFQQNLTVTIGGVAVDPTKIVFKNGGKLYLKGVKSMCPKDVEVLIQIVNPDGGYSNIFRFTR